MLLRAPQAQTSTPLTLNISSSGINKGGAPSLSRLEEKESGRRQGSIFAPLTRCQTVFHIATHSRAGGMVHEKCMWLLLYGLTLLQLLLLLLLLVGGKEARAEKN